MKYSPCSASRLVFAGYVSSRNFSVFLPSWASNKEG